MRVCLLHQLLPAISNWDESVVCLSIARVPPFNSPDTKCHPIHIDREWTDGMAGSRPLVFVGGKAIKRSRPITNAATGDHYDRLSTVLVARTK